jgi:hypothetical protein
MYVHSKPSSEERAEFLESGAIECNSLGVNTTTQSLPLILRYVDLVHTQMHCPVCTVPDYQEQQVLHAGHSGRAV